MSIDINQKLEAIAALEASQSFPKQAIYFQILRYLVKEEKEGDNIKSTTIAIDLLSSKKEKSKKLRDSYIRSKMYTLRKDLELFYANEGKTYPIKMSITKGVYKVVFTGTTLEKKENQKPKLKLHYFAYLSSIILLILCSILFYLYQDKKPSTVLQKNSLVSYFLSHDKPLDIVLGDRSFYREFDPEMKRFRFIYDSDVTIANDLTKFYTIVEQYPERKISDTKDYYHIDVKGMFFAHKLNNEWAYHQQESGLHQASQVNRINKNTLFLSKTYSGDLYNFSSYFENSICDFNSHVIRNSYIDSFTIGDSTYLPHKNIKNSKLGLLSISYCFFKKVIVDNKHSLLFVLPSSNHARSYISEHLYDNKLVLDILASFENNKIDEFELLLEVSGNKTKGLHHKVVYNSTVNKPSL